MTQGSFSLKSLEAPAASPAKTPWGDLEYTTLKLDLPEDLFADDLPRLHPVPWFFENFSKEQVEALFDRAELTPDQKKLLLDKSRWKAITHGWQISPPIQIVRDAGGSPDRPFQWFYENTTAEQVEASIRQEPWTAAQKNMLLDKSRWAPLPTGWQVDPPPEVLRNLSATARKTIYSVLRQCAQNPYIQGPYHFDADTFDDWLAESGLPQDKQELLRQLTFREGDSVYLCDAPLFDSLCSPAERKSMARAYYQSSALLMRLRINPQSDLDALVNYWGQGGRAKVMKPFLQSLARTPKGASVGISYLLPTFPRMRLYTFPDVRNDRLAYYEDCFWTTMNFFNEKPDYSVLNKEELIARFKSGYYEVTSNFRFGDVIAVVSPKGVIHMCVYIADDVVFTKNGMTAYAPWVLLKRSDMLKRYESDKPLHIRVFRKRSAMA